MWLSLEQYASNEICGICLDEFGNKQAIYQLPCGHKFHNNCLVDFCEHNRGEISCPMDRIRVPENDCHAVWAFKNKALGTPSNSVPIFSNNFLMNMYDTHQNGGKCYFCKKKHRQKTYRRRTCRRQTYRKAHKK